MLQYIRNHLYTLKGVRGMTIKQRLIISNILMIVIPVLISAIIIGAGQYLSYQYWKNQYNSESSIYDVPEKITSVATELIQNPQKQKTAEKKQLEDYLQKHSMRLTVHDYNSRTLLLNMGKLDIDPNNKMINAIWSLSGEGSIYLSEEDVYSKKVAINNQTYVISTFDSFHENGNSDDGYYSQYQMLITLFMILFGIGIIVTIFFTNRFLTYFVFKRISQPLDTLVVGVQQIRDGNLDTRIQYESKDEFAAICHDFNDMALQLKQSMQLIQRQEESRKELLASISHDLRSPLTSIRAYSEGLLDGVANTPEAQHKYITMIQTKARDIDRMVAKIFLFSKMDLGNYPYDPELLDVNYELESLVKATAEEYRSKGLYITTSFSDQKAVIFADQLQLDSIFTNIVENSLNYKHKERGWVHIQTRVDHDQITISISDDGPGVPEQSLPQLFDLFYRSDPSRNNPNRGSGLGLAITSKAVERMGGTIKAIHASSGGLQIIIELPLIKQEDIR